MKKKKSFGLPSILFGLTGLIWILSGNIPIGIMFICVALMWINMGNNKKQLKTKKLITLGKN